MSRNVLTSLADRAEKNQASGSRRGLWSTRLSSTSFLSCSCRHCRQRSGLPRASTVAQVYLSSVTLAHLLTLNANCLPWNRSSGVQDCVVPTWPAAGYFLILQDLLCRMWSVYGTDAHEVFSGNRSSDYVCRSTQNIRNHRAIKNGRKRQMWFGCRSKHASSALSDTLPPELYNGCSVGTRSVCSLRR